MEKRIDTPARHAAVHVEETIAAECGNGLIDDLPAFAGVARSARRARARSTSARAALGANNGPDLEFLGVVIRIARVNRTASAAQRSALPAIEHGLNLGNHGERHLFGTICSDVETHRRMHLRRK